MSAKSHFHGENFTSENSYSSRFFAFVGENKSKKNMLNERWTRIFYLFLYIFLFHIFFINNRVEQNREKINTEIEVYRFLGFSKTEF